LFMWQSFFLKSSRGLMIIIFLNQMGVKLIAVVNLRISLLLNGILSSKQTPSSFDSRLSFTVIHYF
jgi:hypothetical protein